MNCFSCGTSISSHISYCPNCGVTINSAGFGSSAPSQSYNQPQQNYFASSQPYNQTTPSKAVGKKSPGLALFLSLLIVGAGQFYNGQVGKGMAFLFGAIILAAFSFGTGWFIVALGSAIDAYTTAKKL